MEELLRADKNIQLEDPTTAALIRRIVTGDESAMTGLYDATKRQVFGLVARIVSDRAVAEEILLDVYSHVWRKAEDYDPESGEAITWLMAIARLRAIDWLQVSKQYPAVMEAGQPSYADVPPEILEGELHLAPARRNLVRAALDSVPPEQRQVIEMAFYHGLSYIEIAGKLAQSPATVRTRTRQGMIKLSDLLRPLFKENA